MRHHRSINMHKRYINVAKKISRYFSQIENVEAIVIGGSLARGFYDDYSDIEMYVYYRGRMPDENKIRDILNELNSSLTRSQKIFWFHKAWGHHTFFKVDEIKIELGYRNIEEINNRIDLFLNKFTLPQHGIHDTPFGHYESGVANCILESIILHEKGDWIRKIRRKLKKYPYDLRNSTIKYYFRDANVITKVKINQAVKRNDTLNFNACLARVIRSLNICIFALNKKYYPGDKWNSNYIHKFSLIPNNYMENIEAILNRGQVSSRDKKYILTLLNKIISDTKGLINKSFKEE